jgi:hypothetical protein
MLVVELSLSIEQRRVEMTERSDRAAGIDELWREAARRASDGQLALLAGLAIPVAVGCATAAFFEVGVLRWWPVLLVPLFLSAFGFWGIADREMHGLHGGSGRSTSGWHALRAAATLLAVGCAVVAALVFLRFTVGTWIS